jgi:hypothetical protein
LACGNGSIVSLPDMVYGHQLRVTIGGAVHDLALIAAMISLDDMRSRVEFLPL